MNNEDSDCIVCWSCDKDVLVREIKENDGFCPYCEQEIEE